MQLLKKIFLVFIAFTAMSSVVLKYSLENERWNSIAKECQQDCNTEEENSAKVYYAVAYEAIVPVFHLQLTHDFLFIIFETELLQELDQSANFEIPEYFNKFCRTLFRRIISPNAP